jgi:DNA ligase-associated metallophosphoesterase
MKPAFPFRIKERQLWLTADGCIFWEEQKTLIVSDLHFGKTGHFRKSGIAVPQAVYREDLHRLVMQIQYFQPRQLIVVGDLFHSDANKELELFKKWRSNFPGLGIQLIKGNHDILLEEWYENCEIILSAKTLVVDGLCFIHDIEHIRNTAEMGFSPVSVNYFFSGHIHPGIRVNGAGRQSICLPCFYFGEQYAVIPAFSRFTGMALIHPTRHENVFAIVENTVVQLQ